MKTEITNVTSDDINELYLCNKTVLPVYYSKDQYNEFIENIDYILLKAVDEQNNKTFMGYIIGKMENKKRFHIISFGVYKEYRRHKVGSMLMSEIEKAVLNKFPAIQYISLNVQNINDIAIKFYETTGFKKIRSLEHYYGENKHGYTFGKKLGANHNLF
jgi:ribosomal-protein-alanine N-acetyltransferase